MLVQLHTSRKHLTISPLCNLPTTIHGEHTLSHIGFIMTRNIFPDPLCNREHTCPTTRAAKKSDKISSISGKCDRYNKKTQGSQIQGNIHKWQVGTSGSKCFHGFMRMFVKRKEDREGRKH